MPLKRPFRKLEGADFIRLVAPKGPRQRAIPCEAQLLRSRPRPHPPILADAWRPAKSEVVLLSPNPGEQQLREEAVARI